MPQIRVREKPERKRIPPGKKDRGRFSVLTKRQSQKTERRPSRPRHLYSTVTTAHSYVTQNGKVVRETIGSGTTAKVLDFIYDESSKPFALIYTNGTATPVTYYYVLNLQGDVVGLIDASGEWVAKYAYSAWGEITASSGTMADLNPLRYRGYYYDTETGFYYLQSRYYDPVTHRFINADSLASTGQGFTGMNMFAYCLNNPVISIDNAGTLSSIISTETLIRRYLEEIEDEKPGYIDDQDAEGIGDIPFGFARTGHGACGAISIYNLLIKTRGHASLRRINNYIAMTGHQLLGGWLGMTPSQVGSVLTQLGYSVYITGDPDEIAYYSTIADGSILWYAYSNENTTIGAHFTMYEKSDDGYLFHNVGPDGTFTHSDPYAMGQLRGGFCIVAIFVWDPLKKG